jgi:hypothetical protein
VPFNQIWNQGIKQYFGPIEKFKSLGGYPFIIGVHTGYDEDALFNFATRLTREKMRWLRYQCKKLLDINYSNNARGETPSQESIIHPKAMETWEKLGPFKYV